MCNSDVPMDITAQLNLSVTYYNISQKLGLRKDKVMLSEKIKTG
jgi:hypothetical protein